MLVLTRKQNQTIIIGECIEVKVARISGNSVRIAVNAPRAIPVYRKEIAPLYTGSAGLDVEPETERMISCRL